MLDILRGVDQKYLNSLTPDGLKELMITRFRILSKAPTTAELLRDSHNGYASLAQVQVEQDAKYYPT